jgi:hypothetical protein
MSASKRYLIPNILVCVMYLACWITLAWMGARTSFDPKVFVWSYFPLWMLANARPAAMADGIALVGNSFVLATFVLTHLVAATVKFSVFGYAACVAILMALTIRGLRSAKLQDPGTRQKL